jgi:hypothetical protein
MKTIIVEIQNKEGKALYAFSVDFTEMAYQFAIPFIRDGKAVCLYCLYEDSRLPLAV